MAARVFQIAYDRTLLHVREMLLAQCGYTVASACGNSEACQLLATEAPFDAFFVSWSATHDERKAIVLWLKQHWPSVPVVAIHDSFQSPIPGADFIATHDTPQEWLAAIEVATRPIGGARALA